MNRVCLRVMQNAVLFGCAMMLAGCATIDKQHLADNSIPAFDAREDVSEHIPPATAEFLAVDDDMREFVRVNLLPIRDRLHRLRRLSALLLDPGTLGIDYQADLTLSARETFHQRAGNCLSFTALLVVLAREAGLNASFQDVPVVPNWRPSGESFVIERHVNAVVRVGGREFVIDFRPPDAPVAASARKIEDASASAQYFGNLAVELLTSGDLAGAHTVLQRGLAVDVESLPLWVNLGVVLGRNRQYADAQRAYRRALALEPGNLSALSNLAGLQEFLGNQDSARELRKRVERYRRQNPYYLLWLGEQKLRDRAAEAALTDFSTAARRVPEEADFHFAMARALHALGRHEQALRSLNLALQLATGATARAQYRAQFDSLK